MPQDGGWIKVEVKGDSTRAASASSTSLDQNRSRLEPRCKKAPRKSSLLKREVVYYLNEASLRKNVIADISCRQSENLSANKH